jgi:inorganic triphosphatase YgiF
MVVETALKLLLPPERIADLGRVPAVAAATRGRPVSRQVHTVYYDTPERDLARHGMALRLRRAGARWIQTLKAGGRVRGGLHERGEYDAPAAAQLLNFVALAATPAAGLLADAGLRARLQPVFVTDFRRTSRTVDLGTGTLAELCADHGSIVAGTRSAPISEIEIELREGDPARLFAWTRTLVDQLPLRLSDRSKAERGYALLDPRPSTGPARSEAPVLDPDMDPAAAFDAIVSSCLVQLQANEHGVLVSDDVEYVHQARVALRRLRSAFSLFRPAVPRASVEPLLGALRSLGMALGAARDWDVFVTETLPPLDAALGHAPGLPGLLVQAQAHRAAARTAARQAVAAPTFTALLLDLGEALVKRPWRGSLDERALALQALPLKEFAARLLSRQARRVRRAGRGIGRLDAEGLHALRIEVKKLRYAAEFLQRLHTRREVRECIACTAELQDILGGLNDASVTARLLSGLDCSEPAVAHAAGLVHGWTAARAREGLGHLSHAWSRIEAARPFW